MAAGMSCWPAATAGPQSVIGPSRSLFAKGLAKGCTSAHLHAIFSNFGVVTDCQVGDQLRGRHSSSAPCRQRAHLGEGSPARHLRQFKGVD